MGKKTNIKKASLTDLIAAAAEVRENAYAPYSGYKVGATLLTESGKVFRGCNVENASYGLTICAERNAIIGAVASGERKFKQLVIVAEGSTPFPCGACLQVISEFAPKLRVTISDVSGKKRTNYTLDELMPKQFNLGKK